MVPNLLGLHSVHFHILRTVNNRNFQTDPLPNGQRRPTADDLGAGGLQLGVFCVGGMREPGAVSGIAGRGVLMGFGAGSGPPTRGVFLDFAHFGAAAVRVGFGARAVADRRWGALQRAWSVRQHWPAPGRQSHDAVQR